MCAVLRECPVDDVKRREGVAFVDALVNNSRR